MNAHRHDLRPFAHSHAFGDRGSAQRQRALAIVTAITLATMVAELAGGWWSGSLALTADGWHMGTHAFALGGAVLAYRLSHRASRRRGQAGGRTGFAFGGWKIEVLSAYTSGLMLMLVAIWLIVDAIAALRSPRPIAFGEAMMIAMIGLVVNVASVWLLARATRPGDAQGQGHEHADRHAGTDGHSQDHAHHPPHAGAADVHGHSHAHHGHAHHRHDHNFSAAYLHVLADAFTSVLAIAALAGGLWFGWGWLDAAVALLGAAVIGQWSLSVLRTSGRALIDATEDPVIAERIRERIESDGDAKLADLHVWQVGAQAWSAVVSIVADRPLEAAAYRLRLDSIETLRHVTVEVHRCRGPQSGASAPAVS
jgi:cation diffusion facilitator family transporter